MAITFNHNDKLYVSGSNVGIGTDSPGQKLEVNVASGDGILIKSADVATFKMKGSGGVYDWGLATTNLAAHDFGIYKSNANGGDPISAGTAQLYFKSTGSTTTNIGIGTTSPGAKLDIQGTGVAATPTVSIVNTSSATFNHAINAFAPNLTDGENNAIFIGKEGSTKNSGYIGYKYSSAGSNDNVLTFGHWASDNLMNLTGDGKLGIGTTSPSGKLEVSDTTTGIAAIIGNTTHNSRLQIYTASVGKNSEIWFGDAADDDIGKIDYDHADNSLSFFTNTAEAIRITSSGNVCIGTTSPAGPLTVQSDSGAASISVVGRSSDSISSFDFYNTTKSAAVYIQSNGSYLRTRAEGGFHFAKGTTPSTADTNAFTVEGLNVGIGETSPSYRLSVKINGDVYSGDFYQADSGTDKYNSVRIRGAMTSAVGYCGIGGSTVANTSFRDSFVVGTQTAHSFNLATSDTARMTIDSSGNVGIGTASPDTKLHIYENAAAPVLLTLNNYQADINPNGSQGNFIDFKMTDDNATFTPQVRIGMIVKDSDGDSGLMSEGCGNFVVYTAEGTDQAGNGTLTEHFRITDKGKVGIGTTSPDQTLHVNSSSTSVTGIAVTNTSTGVARVYFDASNGDVAGSDYMWIGQNNDLSGEIVMTQSAGAFHIKTQPGGTVTSRLTVLQDGNVGIGTTGPNRFLTVSETGAANGSQNITASITNVTVGATSSAIYIGAYTGTDWLIGKNIYGNSNHYNFEIGNQASGSSPVISINNSNNVGIGTISPGAKLDVRADAPSTSGSIIYVRNTLADGSNNTFGGISFFSSPGTDYTIGKLNTGSASALAFSNANNGTEYMRIDSSGNVGIGTDSPGIELDVAGGIRATAGTSNGLRVHTNSGITASNNYMNFFTSQSSGWAFNANGTGADSDTKVVITAGGNVGIGTTAPAKKLTIGGSSPHVLLDGNFDDDSKANQGRVYFNDYNFGIGAGHMSADVNTDDDLYLWTYDGGGRGIRFMSTTNGDTDVTGTAWKTMMVITSDADGGNVGIGTTTPGAKLDVEGLILSDQIQTKEYTSLTGSSGDWFPIGAITDQYTGPVRYSILTYAHSSIDFIVSEAYSLANTHNITVLNSNYGANGGFANVSAVRVRQDGGVEIKLVWSSGPSVQVRITVRGTYGTPTLPSSLATTTNTSTVIDTVDNGSGKMRTQKTLEVGSTVLLNYSGSSYLNGGNFGIGTTSPGAKLTIVSGGKGIHVDKGSHSSTSANLSECRTNYAFAYDTLRNGSTTGFFITNVGTNTPAMQAVDSSNNAQNISIQPYGGNVGIGTTSPDFKLDTRISRASGSFLTDGQVYALGLQNTDTTAGNATAMAFGHGGYKYTNFIASVRTGTGANPKGDLVFGGRPTDASTFVERMRILANGNVGIGTTGPNQKLHVEGAISAGTANSTSGSLILVGKYNNGNIITIGGEYSNGGIVIGYGVKPSTTASGAFLSSSGLANLQRGAYNQVGSDHYWWGGTYQTVAEGSAVTMSRLMTLNGAGNLGLGTTSPNYRLHVDNSGLSTNSAALYVKNPNSSSNAVIAEFVGDSDAIQIKNINVGDYAIYNTQQSNGIALYDGTGGVEIHYNGSTRLEADSNGGIKVTGQLSATGDVVAYSSDERLKENIKPIENAVDKIKQLKGVTFDWNEKSQELGFEPSTKTNDVGVIAQDVEAVFPQLVHLAPFDIGSDEEGKATSKTGEDYKTVNYARLTAVLIEAVKEQQQQIDELKEIINGLTK